MSYSASTRLRYISSPSPEGLEYALQGLGFKVEVKSIVYADHQWWAWFVLPDSIRNPDFVERINQINKAVKGEEIDVSSTKLPG